MNSIKLPIKIKTYSEEQNRALEIALKEKFNITVSISTNKRYHYIFDENARFPGHTGDISECSWDREAWESACTEVNINDLISINYEIY